MSDECEYSRATPKPMDLVSCYRCGRSGYWESPYSGDVRIGNSEVYFDADDFSRGRMTVCGACERKRLSKKALEHERVDYYRLVDDVFELPQMRVFLPIRDWLQDRAAALIPYEGDTIRHAVQDYEPEMYPEIPDGVDDADERWRVARLSCEAGFVWDRTFGSAKQFDKLLEQYLTRYYGDGLAMMVKTLQNVI